MLKKITFTYTCTVGPTTALHVHAHARAHTNDKIPISTSFNEDPIYVLQITLFFNRFDYNLIKHTQYTINITYKIL